MNKARIVALGAALALCGCPDRTECYGDNAELLIRVTAAHQPVELQMCQLASDIPDFQLDSDAGVASTAADNSHSSSGRCTTDLVYHQREEVNSDGTSWSELWRDLLPGNKACSYQSWVKITAANCEPRIARMEEIKSAPGRDEKAEVGVELNCWRPIDCKLCTAEQPVCDIRNSRCAECSAAYSGKCTGNTPVCDVDRGVCVPCTAAQATACPRATPACDKETGQCVLCTVAESKSCWDPALPACDAKQHSCVQCTAEDDSACRGTTPACDTDTHHCVQCSPQEQSACSGATPVCHADNHHCVECNAADSSACKSPHSLCAVASGRCVECTPRDTSACKSEQPFCNLDGRCAACKASDASRCVGDTPVCGLVLGACTRCGADYGEPSSSACPSDAAPYCKATGGCDRCTGNADCVTGTHPGPVCNAASGQCENGTACTSDSGCRNTDYCSAPTGSSGGCRGKLANGMPLPSGPVELTTCSDSVGKKVCSSGVCQLEDGRCGFTNGSACSAAAECRSGHCTAGICAAN